MMIKTMSSAFMTGKIEAMMALTSMRSDTRREKTRSTRKGRSSRSALSEGKLEKKMAKRLVTTMNKSRQFLPPACPAPRQ